jgi:ABC-2 type transport system ATP-binding protein
MQDSPIQNHASRGSGLALQVEGLQKSFRSGKNLKQIPVLKGVDLRVEYGQIYGFLGANGAGKSTTIKIMMDILKPSDGKIKVLGEPLGSRKAKEKIGFLPERPVFYEHLNARELLEFYGQCFGLKKADLKEKIQSLLDRVGLKGKEDLPIRKFSKGMVQRIGIAQALINDPDLVVLDEPLSGLDPVGRKDLRDIIVEIASEGKTVFFSSHIIQDIESICSHVSFIDSGRMVFEGPIGDLIDQHSVGFEIQVPKDTADLEDELPISKHLVRGNDRILFCADEASKNECLKALVDKGISVEAVQKQRKSLEELFFKLRDSEVIG